MRRIVCPALYTDWAPAPVWEVRGLVSFSLSPRRHARRRRGSRDHRILYALLLCCRPLSLQGLLGRCWACSRRRRTSHLQRGEASAECTAMQLTAGLARASGVGLT